MFPRRNPMSYPTYFDRPKLGGGSTLQNVCSALDCLANVADLPAIIGGIPNFEELLATVEDFIEKCYNVMYPDGEDEDSEEDTEDSEEEDEPPRKKIKLVEHDE